MNSIRIIERLWRVARWNFISSHFRGTWISIYRMVETCCAFAKQRAARSAFQRNLYQQILQWPPLKWWTHLGNGNYRQKQRETSPVALVDNKLGTRFLRNSDYDLIETSENLDSVALHKQQKFYSIQFNPEKKYLIKISRITFHVEISLSRSIKREILLFFSLWEVP